MNILESIRIAFSGLSANKMRSILTMLGIIIGTAAVITLVSVGQGVRQVVAKEIQGIGSNILYVIPGNIQESPGRSSFLRSVSTTSLTYGDAVAIADPRNVPDVQRVAPEFVGSAKVIYGNKNANTSVNGVTPGYEEVRNFHVQMGDFISVTDMTNEARVCVLGQTVLKKLFPAGATPIGQTIKINRVPFRVIGVMKEKGGGSFGDEDDVVFVPLSTAHARLFRDRSVSGDYSVSVIYAAVADESRMEIARAQIAELLRRRHGLIFGHDDDDFAIITQADVISVMGSLTAVLTLFLGVIAAISLIVGGIGIMNIMLVSVTERTREIGIRKAVGAKRRDILGQFLIEAVVLALIGGFIGIVLGIGGAKAISRVATDLTTYVSIDIILMATGFSAAVGLFFGMYPAVRASRLNPIDALRYE